MSGISSSQDDYYNVGLEITPEELYQQRNEEAAGHFAAGVLGILCLFIFYLWAGPLFRSHGARYKGIKICSNLLRKSRKKLLAKVPGFVSMGHAVIFGLYIIITLGVLFTNIDWSILSQFSKRLGWLTVLNIALTVFLGLKNTPLALISVQSYEKLNCLHQIAGYSSIAFLVLHAGIYSAYLGNIGYLSVLVEKDQIMGIVAGISMLIIFVTATFLRKRNYEKFYVVHVLMVTLLLVMAVLHRPDLIMTKSSTILIFAGGIWALDRLLIFAKYLVYGLNSTATITPLPHGATRVVFSKSIPSTIPGQHFFIWIPSIRTFQTHPFTCISTNPIEFVVSAQNGFTRSLYDRAVKEPGATLKASLVGPYGIIPNLTAFHKVIFIAGGTGATYTCSLANDLICKLGPSSKTSVEFILTQKYQESLEWTSRHLSTLVSTPTVALYLYVTRGSSGESTKNTSIPTGPADSSSGNSDLEKNTNMVQPVNNLTLPMQEKTDDTLIISDPHTNMPFVLHLGRPDIELFIAQAVNNASNSDRIAVVACGPTPLMQSVRKAVVNNITNHGPGVELFSEEFGW